MKNIFQGTKAGLKLRQLLLLIFLLLKKKVGHIRHVSNASFLYLPYLLYWVHGWYNQVQGSQAENRPMGTSSSPKRKKVLHPRWINMFHSTTPTGSLVALQKKEQLASESERLHCISAHAFGLLARFLVLLAMKHAGQCLLKVPKTATRVCMTNAHHALGPTRHFWTSNFEHIRRVKAKVGL